MSIRPVFIAGCDRSGTTLLGDLLGNTSWTVTTPESQFIHDLMVQIKLGSFESSLSAAKWLNDNFRYVVWNLQLSAHDLAHSIDLNNPRKTVENLVECYIHRHQPTKNSADVWVDHTPDNFKFHPVLKSLFPEARFIHIVRDGRAICASIKHLDWGPNNAYSASRHWAERLQQAVTVEVAEGNCLMRVRYEDLVENPSRVLKEICAFIDIPFEPGMLKGGGLKLPDFTRKQHQLIGQSAHTDRAYAWRQQLTRYEIRQFESYPHSHTLLKQMGYEVEYSDPPKLLGMQILASYCHEFLMYLRNRRKHRNMELQAVSQHRQRTRVIPRVSPQQ